MAESIHAFRFPVAVDRGRGELRHEPELPRYVNQLIRQVLLTAPGERAHRPNFGAGLRRVVFGPNDDATATLLQATILQALNENLSSLIDVDSVETLARESTLEVTITYTLKARGQREVLNLEVTT